MSAPIPTIGAEAVTLTRSIETWEKRLALVREHAPGTSFSALCEAWRDYYLRVARARDEGKKLAWVSFFAPVELLHTLDIVPFNPEQHIVAYLARGEEHDLFDIGVGAGFSKSCCSPHIAAVGAAKAGLLPKPDLLLSTAPPCDSNAVMFKAFNHLFQVPTHFIDYPYRYDDEAVAYLTEEIRDAVTFLEEQTGQRFDVDRFREILRISNGIHRAHCRVNELRKNTPSPLRGRWAFSLVSLKYMSDGTPATLQYFEALDKDLRERIGKGEYAVPAEKRRIMWTGVFPFFHMKLLDWIEDEFEAVVLAVLSFDDFFLSGNAEWDLRDPFAALARKMLFYSGSCFLGPFSYDIQMKGLIQMCRDMRVNAQIYFAPLGCREGCGYMRLFKDTLKREAGLPTLVLDGDPGDARVVSVEQMKLKVTEFFRMMEGD